VLIAYFTARISLGSTARKRTTYSLMVSGTISARSGSASTTAQTKAPGCGPTVARPGSRFGRPASPMMTEGLLTAGRCGEQTMGTMRTTTGGTTSPVRRTRANTFAEPICPRAPRLHPLHRPNPHRPGRPRYHSHIPARTRANSQGILSATMADPDLCIRGAASAPTASTAVLECRRSRRSRRHCRLRHRRGRLSSRQPPRPRPDPPRLQGPPRAQHRWTAITSTYRGHSSDAKTLSACSWSNALTRTRRATLATPRRTFVPAGSAAILPSCHRRRPLSRRYCDAFQPILTTVVGKQAGITRLAWMHRRS